MSAAGLEIVCPTLADTQALAARVAALVRPGDVLVLSGGLGAGKTSFTAGLAAGLGVEEPVVSPTFVLVRRYRSGFMPLIHVDVYRLGSINEFDDLEVFELARDGVLVIEWGDAVDAAIPEDQLRVMFTVGEDGSRTIGLLPFGSWSQRPLEVLE
ncbi:MAG: tRNA (adenosine(37)-N6)-threonylcarbamoyltransferase complex ATPase subunit type 1 TsaE [Actinobacteria bacterium]|nr:tRNA (adenosine(37)-N6)-threonylcarbamoyltransferase complex ATPase subunit type 1 TsaE [Actinomycetota bacterium]MCI0677534.1 tRNA (adenosine(37)-N6)-threonylcarbamoyltransferase complex ATPase subunit type 1 TsaE [Actinomycetota bacterium]